MDIASVPCQFLLGSQSSMPIYMFSSQVIRFVNNERECTQTGDLIVIIRSSADDKGQLEREAIIGMVGDGALLH